MTLCKRGSSSICILLHIVPGAKSIGHHGTGHDDDGSHLGLIQLDLSAKGLDGCDGTDQTFGI